MATMIEHFPSHGLHGSGVVWPLVVPNGATFGYLLLSDDGAALEFLIDREVVQAGADDPMNLACRWALHAEDELRRLARERETAASAVIRLLAVVGFLPRYSTNFEEWAYSHGFSPQG